MILQDADIVQRIAIDHQAVCVVALLKLSYFVGTHEKFCHAVSRSYDGSMAI